LIYLNIYVLSFHIFTYLYTSFITHFNVRYLWSLWRPFDYILINRWINFDAFWFSKNSLWYSHSIIWMNYEWNDIWVWKRNVTFDRLHFDYRMIKQDTYRCNESFSLKNPVYNKQTETYRGQTYLLPLLKWLVLVALPFFSGTNPYTVNILFWY